MNNTRIFLRLAVAAFVLCLAASAQETSPITHVSLFKVKPARMAEWIKATHKNYVPVMDKLVADGTILAYGINTAVLHRAGLPNADAWFTVPDYGAYEKVQMAVEKAQAAAPVTFASMMEMMDLEAHSDLLLRAHFANQKTPPKGALPYTSLALFKAKPGKAPELAKAIERFFRPALDPLVESGDLFSYGLFEESEHSDPGMLYFVATVPSMASLDKLNAAFASAAGLQSSSTSIRETMLELSEPSEHRDYIMRAHAFAVR